MTSYLLIEQFHYLKWVNLSERGRNNIKSNYFLLVLYRNGLCNYIVNLETSGTLFDIFTSTFIHSQRFCIESTFNMETLRTMQGMRRHCTGAPDVIFYQFTFD